MDEARRKQARSDQAVRQLDFGKRVVKKARSLIGTPYVWGDKSGRYGFDCSGYTAFVFQHMGVTLTGSARDQYGQGSSVDKAGLMPGDLVFFLGSSSPMHVGIYQGDGLFLHAPGTGKRIQTSSLLGGSFARRLLGGRRLGPPENTIAKPAPLGEKGPDHQPKESPL